MRPSDLHKILSCQCEQASLLISESLDRELTLGERMALGLHKLLCHKCRRVTRQLRRLHELFARLPEALQKRLVSRCCQLSQTRKLQITEAMRKASS